MHANWIEKCVVVWCDERIACVGDKEYRAKSKRCESGLCVVCQTKRIIETFVRSSYRFRITFCVNAWRAFFGFWDFVLNKFICVDEWQSYENDIPNNIPNRHKDVVTFSQIRINGTAREWKSIANKMWIATWHSHSLVGSRINYLLSLINWIIPIGGDWFDKLMRPFVVADEFEWKFALMTSAQRTPFPMFGGGKLFS